MKILEFGPESYTRLASGDWTYNRTDTSIIGSFELLWSAICKSQLTDLKRKDLRTIKNLKRKLREISIYKDLDKDSRILNGVGKNKVILEDEEFEMLKSLLEANSFLPIIAEDLDSLWSKIDNAKDYTIVEADHTPKPI